MMLVSSRTLFDYAGSLSTGPGHPRNRQGTRGVNRQGTRGTTGTASRSLHTLGETQSIHENHLIVTSLSCP